MRRLFLLRAYGDFSIAIQSILKSNQVNDLKVVASLHLAPLYLALSKAVDLKAIDIEFVDFDVHRSQLNLFTNRHFFEADTFSQIKKIKQYLAINPNIDGVDYIEQDKRRLLLEIVLNHQFKPIVTESNVYEQFGRFFQIPSIVIKNKIPDSAKILLLPDARIEKRNIPENIIHSIQNKSLAKGYTTNVAYFKRQISGATMYKNFDDLIELIMDADFIVGADSLPIHLSYFFKKPHCIVYPIEGAKDFFTPFALENNYYIEFDSIEIPFLS
jgi:uncharacterized membrane protein YobD (UPF0266 family)